MALKFLLAGLVVSALAVTSANAGECSLTQAAEAGKSVSNQCKSCHVFEAAKPSRASVAPNLHEVFGAIPGSRRDFPGYSEGMLGAAEKGEPWNETNLFDYLADPKAYLAKVNGHDVKHKMYFQLKDDQKRKDVIAFLKAIKGHPECD